VDEKTFKTIPKTNLWQTWNDHSFIRNETDDKKGTH
jgi:hypothetical protein